MIQWKGHISAAFVRALNTWDAEGAGCKWQYLVWRSPKMVVPNYIDHFSIEWNPWFWGSPILGPPPTLFYRKFNEIHLLDTLEVFMALSPRAWHCPCQCLSLLHPTSMVWYYSKADQSCWFINFWPVPTWGWSFDGSHQCDFRVEDVPLGSRILAEPWPLSRLVLQCFSRVAGCCQGQFLEWNWRVFNDCTLCIVYGYIYSYYIIMHM